MPPQPLDVALSVSEHMHTYTPLYAHVCTHIYRERHPLSDIPSHMASCSQLCIHISLLAHKPTYLDSHTWPHTHAHVSTHVHRHTLTIRFPDSFPAPSQDFQGQMPGGHVNHKGLQTLPPCLLGKDLGLVSLSPLRGTWPSTSL